MKSFVVNTRELRNKKKNPKFSLSPKNIMKNQNIKKQRVFNRKVIS